jgi:hypothetical protein
LNVVVEHADLEIRPVRAVAVHQLARRRLDNVMDVHGRPARVGPETGVDLFRLDQLVNDGRASAQEAAELVSLVVSEL